MKRIVYPQKGSGSARAALSARHVTVKYKPSEKFLTQLKNRRKPAFSAGDDLSEGADLQAPEPVQLPVLPKERATLISPSEGLSNPPQLPRLSAFLEDVEQPKRAAVPSPRETIERFEGSNSTVSRKKQPKSRSGQSAYEELRARWRHS